MQNQSKLALITGSTQGIGLAIANRLSLNGYTVILHSFEAKDIGNRIAAELSSSTGGIAYYVQADLTNVSQAEQLYAQATTIAGVTPDVLVNNAGTQFTSPIESFPTERWDAIIAINLASVFYTMRAAVPAMREKKWGRIVNIASVHGLVASVNKTAYLASKHGVVGMSKGVALETATDGITVNCICPGWVETPLIQPQIDARAAQFGGDLDAGVRDLVREKQPNQRLSKTDEIAQAVAFLCSEGAQGITGISLPVDGGWTAQ